MNDVLDAFEGAAEKIRETFGAERVLAVHIMVIDADGNKASVSKGLSEGDIRALMRNYLRSDENGTHIVDDRRRQ